MRWTTKLLHLFIAPDVHPREEQKLRLLGFTIVMGTLINVYVFFALLVDGNGPLLVMNLALVLSMSVIPLGLMMLRRYSATKHVVALFYPFILTAINMVYGDMHTELIYSAMAILIVYMMDNQRQRIILVSWVAICFVANLILMKGNTPAEPLVAFEAYEKVVEWMVYLLGFATNILLVTVIMIQNRKYQKQLFNTNLELRQLNQNKDKFMSVISHDLRGPFTSILGLLDALRNGHEEYTKTEVQDMIEVLDDAANNTYKLLEDLLSWSKVRLGRMDYLPERMELHEEVGTVVSLLAPVAELKGVQLTNMVPPQLMVWADRTMIQTIFRNLLSNGIKFTEPKGLVEVAAVKEDGQVTIRVTDSGIGMSPKQQEHVLAFTRVNSTPGTARESGSGLGLLICKEFVDQHKGKIWFESEWGSGTSFFIQLPGMM